MNERWPDPIGRSVSTCDDSWSVDRISGCFPVSLWLCVADLMECVSVESNAAGHLVPLGRELLCEMVSTFCLRGHISCFAFSTGSCLLAVWKKQRIRALRVKDTPVDKVSGCFGLLRVARSCPAGR